MGISGDQFKKMILPISAKLFRIALMMLSGEDDAKDTIQDLYSKLWEQRDKLSEIHNPEAYCVTMIKNLCINRLKMNNRYEILDIMEQEYKLPLFETPEESMIMKENIRKVYQEIDHLPLIQKQVLHLKQFRNCSFEEISEITGLSEGNVRVILSRARKTLKEKIQ
ncbi:MAG: polymerase sigma factor [Bacteroidetes bacterium]|nr:polymerase sigma factor [Bacteroidota bacterium]